MVIKKITIITNPDGPDRVYLETDLPNGRRLYNADQAFSGDVAAGTGEEYVKKHFPGIPFTVVEI
jgi:hypothetical protein